MRDREHYAQILDDLRPFRDARTGEPLVRIEDVDRASAGGLGLLRFRLSGGVAYPLRRLAGPYDRRVMGQWTELLRRLGRHGVRLPNVDLLFSLLDEPRVYAARDANRSAAVAAVRAAGDAQRRDWWSPRDAHTLALVQAQCGAALPAHAAHHMACTSPDWSSVTHLRVPLLSKAKIDGCTLDVLMPDWLFSEWDPAADRAREFSARPAHAWPNKTDDVFWRGSSTGGRNLPHTWRQNHRVRFLLDVAPALGADVDARLTDVVQCVGSACAEMRAALPPGAVVPFEAHWRHRYLLDLEGNSYSARLKRLLLSNSLVLRAAPVFAEFWHRWLRAWEHYVPLRADASDLAERLRWAREHPREALAIVARANEFVRTRLRTDDVDCYVYRLVVELARVFAYHMPEPPDGVPEGARFGW